MALPVALVTSPGIDGRYEAVEMKPTSDLPGCGQDDSSQHDSRPDDTTGVKAVEIISESSGEDEPDYDETDGQQNDYAKARNNVQRVIDVTLLINNVSRLSTIQIRSHTYEPYQFQLLLTWLALSIVGQIIAGVCFFINRDRENNEATPPTGSLNEATSPTGRLNYIDYVAYVCVFLVFLLNIFVSAFDASWSSHVVVHAAGNKSMMT